MFELPQSIRTSRKKDVYVGNWQLLTQFKLLNQLVADVYNRDLVIGHSLIYSLLDFEPKKYIQSSSKFTLEMDELRSYYDTLYIINNVLLTEKINSEELVVGLKSRVLENLAEKIKFRPQHSKLLTSILEETNLLNLKNPSEYIKQCGNNIYRLVNDSGLLKGNRVIQSTNYDAIKLAFKKSRGENFGTNK